jgi:hypothetical protein
VLFAKYNEIDVVEEDEMGRVCSTNGRQAEGIYVIDGKPEGKWQLRSRKRVRAKLFQYQGMAVSAVVRRRMVSSGMLCRENLKSYAAVRRSRAYVF